MKDRIRQYRNSEFLKNSLVTVTGTIAAQAIVLLLQPFLRRMYPAADFGYFSIYTALAGIPVVIATFRYELAIMLPRSQKEADNIMVGAFFINVIFSTVLGILLFVFAHPLLDFLNVEQDFLPWLYAVAPAVFFYANYTLWNGWLVRKKDFPATTWLKINRRISEGTGQLGFTAFPIIPGLMGGELLGRFVFNISGVYYLFKNGFSFKYVKWPSVKRLLNEYIRFPKYSLFPTLLNSAGLLLPAIMFNRLFGKEETGYFDLTLQTLGVPVMFVINSLSVVINEKLASAYRNRESVLQKVYRIFRNLVLVGLAYFLVFATLSPFVFGVIFGNQYEISGVYAQILAFTFALRLVVFPFAVTFAALDMIKSGSLIQYIHFILIGVYFFVKPHEPTTWLAGYAVLEAAVSCLYFILIIKAVKRYETSIQIN